MNPRSSGIIVHRPDQQDLVKREDPRPFLWVSPEIRLPVAATIAAGCALFAWELTRAIAPPPLLGILLFLILITLARIERWK